MDIILSSESHCTFKNALELRFYLLTVSNNRVEQSDREF